MKPYEIGESGYPPTQAGRLNVNEHHVSYESVHKCVAFLFRLAEIGPPLVQRCEDLVADGPDLDELVLIVIGQGPVGAKPASPRPKSYRSNTPSISMKW